MQRDHQTPSAEQETGRTAVPSLHYSDVDSSSNVREEEPTTNQDQFSRDRYLKQEYFKLLGEEQDLRQTLSDIQREVELHKFRDLILEENENSSANNELSRDLEQPLQDEPGTVLQALQDGMDVIALKKACIAHIAPLLRKKLQGGTLRRYESGQAGPSCRVPDDRKEYFAENVPWRLLGHVLSDSGLEVLLRAMQELENIQADLHRMCGENVNFMDIVGEMAREAGVVSSFWPRSSSEEEGLDSILNDSHSTRENSEIQGAPEDRT